MYNIIIAEVERQQNKLKTIIITRIYYHEVFNLIHNNYCSIL